VYGRQSAISGLGFSYKPIDSPVSQKEQGSLIMQSYTVQTNPSKDDTSWRFTVPLEAFRPRRRRDTRILVGKTLRFTPQAIIFEMNQLPNNRILHDDDPSRFILALFSELRFPDSNLRATADYISRMMKTGIFLNDVQYRFYHHSNSQLVRLCNIYFSTELNEYCT
jgi:hypothetical protein